MEENESWCPLARSLPAKGTGRCPSLVNKGFRQKARAKVNRISLEKISVKQDRHVCRAGPQTVEKVNAHARMLVFLTEIKSFRQSFAARRRQNQIKFRFFRGHVPRKKHCSGRKRASAASALRRPASPLKNACIFEKHVGFVDMQTQRPRAMNARGLWV